MLIEYECKKCYTTYEKLEPHEPHTQIQWKCPDCGSRARRRLISLPGPPVFKGSGFYETTYKKKT